LDEVEKFDAKLSAVGYDVVMNLILTAWVSMSPKAAVRLLFRQRFFGVYSYCQKLKTQPDKLNG
jgi:hypothetical protein